MTQTAYGFIDLQSLYNQRASVVGVPRIMRAVEESAAEYSRVMNAIVADWAEATEVAKENVQLPGDGTLQPLDEHGNPLPVQPSGSYDTAYPIVGGGTAWGTDRIVRNLMTVQEVNNAIVDATQRDSDWMIRHMLAAVVYPSNYNFVDKIGPNGAKGLGTIVVTPLANGDTVVYNRKGNTTPAIDNHYLFQAAAIADATNPYPTIDAELNEHPSNGNRRIMCYIPTGLVATTMALTSFVPAENFDVRPGVGADVAINVPQVGPGERVLGTIAGTRCWIIEWSGLPAGYIISKVEGKAFLKMREYPSPALKGLFSETASADGNHQENRLLRYAGFGVSDRVAACVTLIGAGSYTAPTGYTVVPLPV
jgi:hypothetical protein